MENNPFSFLYTRRGCSNYSYSEPRRGGVIVHVGERGPIVDTLFPIIAEFVHKPPTPMEHFGVPPNEPIYYCRSGVDPFMNPVSLFTDGPFTVSGTFPKSIVVRCVESERTVVLFETDANMPSPMYQEYVHIEYFHNPCPSLVEYILKSGKNIMTKIPSVLYYATNCVKRVVFNGNKSDPGWPVDNDKLLYNSSLEFFEWCTRIFISPTSSDNHVRRDICVAKMSESKGKLNPIIYRYSKPRHAFMSWEDIPLPSEFKNLPMCGYMLYTHRKLHNAPTEFVIYEAFAKESYRVRKSMKGLNKKYRYLSSDHVNGHVSEIIKEIVYVDTPAMLLFCTRVSEVPDDPLWVNLDDYWMSGYNLLLEILYAGKNVYTFKPENMYCDVPAQKFMCGIGDVDYFIEGWRSEGLVDSEILFREDHAKHLSNILPKCNSSFHRELDVHSKEVLDMPIDGFEESFDLDFTSNLHGPCYHPFYEFVGNKKVEIIHGLDAVEHTPFT